jgi:hypothetical protein
MNKGSIQTKEIRSATKKPIGLLGRREANIFEAILSPMWQIKKHFCLAVFSTIPSISHSLLIFRT